MLIAKPEKICLLQVIIEEKGALEGGQGGHFLNFFLRGHVSLLLCLGNLPILFPPLITPGCEEVVFTS